MKTNWIDHHGILICFAIIALGQLVGLTRDIYLRQRRQRNETNAVLKTEGQGK